ncbi:tetratricopeptide repeat-containing sulfotransferase family protein [Shimia sp. Alg240-R146]|uniref:tetratricopeptide repeat-containing sulfotransferase family protein n=1 Tax=Shimia sp. Alg240-R146 TaxID=2993449 RepID=UPI0022E98F8E|nr:tetratricopeptide repeat-containing sulfotransferase family protein [Shimia sp. Alg240-R146]
MSPLEKAQKQLQAGKWAAALKSAQSGLKKAQTDWRLSGIAGQSLLNLGKPKQAAIFLDRSRKSGPDDNEAHTLLAMALIRADRLEDALLVLEKTPLTPRNELKTQLMIGHIAIARKDAAAVSAAAKRVEAINPDHPESLMLSANACSLNGFNEESAKFFEKAAETGALGLVPYHEAVRHYMRAAQTEASTRVLNAVLEIAPNDGETLLLAANDAAQNGQTDLAVERYERLLQIAPAHAESLKSLAHTLTSEALLELEPRIDKALQHHKKRSSEAALLHFAKAEVFKRAHADDEAAAQSFARANEIEFAARQPFINNLQSEFDLLTSAPIDDPETPSSASNVTPIFVIGLPRSGTTLIEQILSAHSSVVPFGEQSAMRQAVKSVYENASYPSGETIKQEYLKRLPSTWSKTQFFVDKLPANYRFVRAIFAAFPNAKIILADRNPVDTAWSSWRNAFPSEHMTYTFDQASMAEEFNFFRKYTQLWGQQFGDRILTLPYEDTVTDLEAATKTLAQYIGFDWEEAMTRPQDVQRAITTASVHQARQAVYQSSINLGDARAQELKDFIANLDPDLWPELDL